MLKKISVGAYLHTTEQCEIIKGTMVIVNHTIMTVTEIRIWVLNVTELDSCFCRQLKAI